MVWAGAAAVVLVLILAPAVFRSMSEIDERSRQLAALEKEQLARSEQLAAQEKELLARSEQLAAREKDLLAMSSAPIAQTSPTPSAPIAQTSPTVPAAESAPIAPTVSRVIFVRTSPRHSKN